ncbi:Undecaprenyl phosphate-alpha-4-amino-4-deoxy-L-arabinose arabinosyl transferase [Planctomycetes bacterium Poly30]|uniref:Undecaprenyl phosphate-alpha-4-amino-4-deoxy-L-arabinose arabinosyl transferase n=1 Tax=Saltatorellus ferox TaxID=2528018 RepID=A0A518EX71_9BACT|nr:Undecaprenyl phosphate-alpha-4-amino-4-deoxy-L-arabinose arabinosyl transferase [Planctomycetes bacterium Poly30]
MGGWWLFVPLLAWAAFRGWWAPDEPRYAQIARECWDRGEWLVLHICGDIYPDKPPLVYWIAGVFGRFSDWSEFAMRIPSLLATLGSVLLAQRMARRLFGEAAARWVVPLYLGTAMLLEIGGRLQLDPILSFFTFLAAERLTAATEPSGSRAAVSGLALGLGALSKGPVAWLHGGFALVAARLALPKGQRTGIRGLHWVFIVLLAIAPALLWAIFASLSEPILADHLFFGQHLGRLSEKAPHEGPPWQHLLEMPVLLLPTTPLVILALWRAWRTRSDGEPASRNLRFLALWFAFTFLVFSIMPPKRPLYLLPIYPVAALLAAQELSLRWQQGAWRRWIVRVPAGLLLFLGVAVGLALIGARIPAVLEKAPKLDQVLPYGLAGAALSLTLIVFSWLAWRRSDSPRGMDHLVQALGLTFLAAGFFVAPVLDEIKSARSLALEIAALPQKPEAIPVRGVQPEGYRYYGRVPTVRSGDLIEALNRDGDQFLALVETRQYQTLSPEVQERTVELLRGRVGSREVIVLGAKP